MTSRGFLVSSGVTYASTALAVVFMVGFYGWSLRVGTEAFGALQSVTALMFLLFACKGVAGSYVVIHAVGEGQPLALVAARGLRLGLLLGLCLAGIFIALAPWLKAFLHMESSIPFLLIGAAGIPAMLSGVVDGILNVQKRFLALAVSGVLAPAANLILALVLLRDGFNEVDAGWIVFGSQLATCLNAFLIDPSALLITGNESAQRRTAMTEIAALLTASVLFGASLRLDVFWSRHLLSETNAGGYAIAASIAVVLYLITGGLARVTSVSLRSGSDLRLIALSYAIIVGTASTLAAAFWITGQSMLDSMAGHAVPTDWHVLLPLFIALTCYSIIMFDYTCLNVVTKKVHAGIALVLITVQATALGTFGHDAVSIAWTQCVTMFGLMILFSVTLLSAVRRRPTDLASRSVQAHLVHPA